jgi:hypothetical protein
VRGDSRVQPCAKHFSGSCSWPKTFFVVAAWRCLFGVHFGVSGAAG